MTLKDELYSELRTQLGPVARAHGYKGTPPTWRTSWGDGDWAVVNVQSSVYSTHERLRCVVNLSVAPEPWLRSRAQHLGRTPTRVSEAEGLFRKRLHPSGSREGVDTWWEVDDSSSAREAAADIVLQLETSGWSFIDELRSREAQLARLASGDLGFRQRTDEDDGLFLNAEALLMMDEGPSEALEQRLVRSLRTSSPQQVAGQTEFNDWVRKQAALTG